MPQNCVRPRVPILAKPTGATCNLACSYCFFLDKELLYPDGKFRMTEETLESYIRQLIAAHRSSEVTVAWQGGDQVSPRSVRPEQFGRFLIQVFDECIPNGDLYSCNHFVGPDYLLGNIHKNNLLALAGPEEQFRFGQRKYTGLPQFCLQCPVLFSCHGECPKNRFGRTPDGKPGLNYLCAGYGAFFQRVEEPLQILAMLIRAGRPASDVMKILAARKDELTQAFTHAKPDRPCPCASGLTFQECHGWTRSGRSQKSLAMSIGGPRPPVHTVRS